MQSELDPNILSIDTKHLFEQLCTEERLLEGWRAVKKNQGSAGIDQQTIPDFESQLYKEIKRLQQQLQTWTYEPQPVRRVEIPKPDGGTRNLGIPCVRDRVVQAAIKQLLEPILEPRFSASSYGFRPDKGQQQAVDAAQKIIQSGKNYVVDIDLEKFFDKIHQDRLIGRLGNIIQDRRILRLIGTSLRSGVMHNGLVSATTEGATQGSPLSPLLSNLVLDELDKELEKRKLEFCRFADDCNIFAKTQKAAERIKTNISKFIEKKLKLVVNAAKSKVAESSLVKFLGITIVDGFRAIAKKSIQRAMEKVKQLTPRGTHETLEATIKRINTWYRGWSSYYSMTQYPSQLRKIESHIRRRLRARIVDQKKTRSTLLKKLVQRGVPEAKAAKAVYSNNKRWKLSHTRAVEEAYPNRWFSKEMGLMIRSDEKREQWFDINRWVSLA